MKARPPTPARLLRRFLLPALSDRRVTWAAARRAPLVENTYDATGVALSIGRLYDGRRCRLDLPFFGRVLYARERCGHER